MRRLPGFSIWGLSLVLSSLSLLYAQAPSTPAADPNAAANPALASQAPDEMTKKITDLVHAGKYSEAHQLTAGLLIAYPDDERLIKAKALIDKLLAPGSSASAAPVTNQPTQPTSNSNAEQLTGMDKVDYDALIELGRQAQQNTDLEQQKASLKQFMDQSGLFLQKHPDQILLWQLRAASAISLNDPMAGYEAGQKLLAAGIADSTDPNSRRLLAQLRNKGWLDKQNAAFEERKKQFAWLLGIWDVNWKWLAVDANGYRAKARDREQFIATKSGIEGYLLSANGTRNSGPDFKIAILDSGELKWESYLPPADTGEKYVFRWIRNGGFLLPKVLIGRRSDPDGYFRDPYINCGTDTGDTPFYPAGWQPVISSAYDRDKHTMTIVVPVQEPDPELKLKARDNPVTLIFSRAGNPPDAPEQGSSK